MYSYLEQKLRGYAIPKLGALDILKKYILCVYLILL